jgi:hypothetical protein
MKSFAIKALVGTIPLAEAEHLKDDKKDNFYHTRDSNTYLSIAAITTNCYKVLPFYDILFTYPSHLFGVSARHLKSF